MSFSSDAKAELCRAKIDKKCCAVAESYGVLLYCNTFSQTEVRIITASAVAIFAILIIYVLLLDPVGFILTTLVCSFLVMLVMGERKWYVLVFMPIALVIILYLVFNLGLRVPLPKGIFPIL